MAWIKMRAELVSDPNVLRICRLTGMDKYSVIGRLFCFWAWADANSVDGRIRFATQEDLVDVVGTASFVDALLKVKWLLTKKNRIELPHFDRHNGDSAKKRALANQRQKKLRASRSGNAGSVTKTRPEKRREEEITQPPQPPAETLTTDGSAAPKIGGDLTTKSKPYKPVPLVTDQPGLEQHAREMGIDPQRFFSYEDLRTHLIAEGQRRRSESRGVR